jgi:hypothetical protein
MTTNDEHHFNTWLDAYVAGMSTPASRASTDPDPAGVRDAARQFHGLARRAEQRAGTDSTVASYPSNWKDFMSAHGTAGPLPTAARRRPQPAAARTYRGQRWHVAFNIALALVLIATLGLGAWRATDGFQGIGNGGDDPGPGGNTAFAPETRVFTPEAEEATPEATLPLLPTADECTVAPLTVDDVLWYIDNPGEAARNRTMEATPQDAATDAATPTNDEVLATANAFMPGPASPDQLAAMANVQRMWMACVLADSPFQRWAVESPELVKWEASAMFPTFVTEDEARAILEEAERTGVIEPHEDYWTRESSFQMISSTAPPWGAMSPVDDPQAIVYPVALLNPDPLRSWTIDGRTFVVPYVTYLPDGTLLNDGQVDPSAISISEVAANSTELFDTCMMFELAWYPESDWLVVSDIPSCG